MQYLAGLGLLSTLLLATSAQAANFSLDLTSYGLEKISNISFFDLTGGSLISQQTTNGNVTAGNSFTQDGLYRITDFKGFSNTGPSVIQSNLNTTYEIFVRQTGLAGQVTQVNSKGYDYAFTPFSGLVEILLDTNLTIQKNPQGKITQNHKGKLDAGAITLATLEILAPSQGNFKDAVKTGTNGDVNLALDFSWTAAGVWENLNGQDLGLNNSLKLVTNQDGNIVSTKKTGNKLDISTSQNGIGNLQFVAVDEPASAALLLLGAAGLLSRRRRAK